MFHSTNDITSSDSKSSSAIDDRGSVTNQGGRLGQSTGPDGSSLEPHITPDTVELGFAIEDLSLENGEASDEVPASPAQHHVNWITASLLEAFYDGRAVELLNEAYPNRHHDRHSPEAKALGRQMFIHGSQILSSHGLVADGLHVEELKDTRKKYLAGLSSLGLHAIREGHALPVDKSKEHLGTTDHVALSSQRLPLNIELGQILSTPVPNLALEGRPSVRRGISTELSLFDKRRDLGMNITHDLTLPSPHADMRLTARSSPPITRYKADFAEVKLIGKGGFGTVHHVIHLVDNQHYAVKKIPISPKKLKKWRDGDSKEIEAILQEIRTLAKLEHSNVVRYYTAWVEGPGIAEIETNARFRMTPGAGRANWHGRALTNGEPTNTAPRQTSQQGDDGGIVFGDETGNKSSLTTDDEPAVGGCITFEEKSTLQHDLQLSGECEDGNGIIFGKDSDSHSHSNTSPLAENGYHAESTSTISLRNGSNIFTDGDAIAPLKADFSSDHAAVHLHIQMSLYPMSLTTYLSPSPSSSTACLTDQGPAGHCFHLVPSLRMFLGILSGVQYLHAQGIVHRDIKPGNIFLSEDTCPGRAGFVDTACANCPGQRLSQYLNPRIGDFGLVTNIAGADGNNAERTGPNINSLRPKAVGTQFYKPPRPPSSSLRAPLVDEKLDVFASGILLFELLWKFNTKMERQIVLSELSRDSRLPKGFVPRIDRQYGDKDSIIGDLVRALIEGMVNKDPKERWGCRRVREAVEEVLNIATPIRLEH